MSANEHSIRQDNVEDGYCLAWFFFQYALDVFNATCNIDALFVTTNASAPHTMKTLAKCYFGVIEKDHVPRCLLSPRQVAILNCICAPHAQDFLFTIPIDNLGQRMTIVNPAPCCANRLAIPMFSEDGIMMCKEAPMCFLSEDGKDLRPSDLLLFNWIQALHNAMEKKRKYATKCADNGYKFIPFAFSTFGEFDKDALDTFSRIRSLSISHSNNVKSGAFILHRSNMASRVQLSGRITALTTENATLKARVTGKQNSGSKSLAKPKVTAMGMVSDTTKYIPPQRRLNRVAPTPYHTKKQVTFQGNPRQSSRPTPTRVVQQQRQPTIPISHSTRRVDQKWNLTNQNHVASDWRTYRTCFNSQPSPGFPTRNERLSSGNCDSYVVQNWKPVNHKTKTIKHVFQPVKQVVTPVKKVWKAIGKVFARVGFHWQPTGRMFTLDDMCPLSRITSSKVLPVKHSSSVSTSVDVVVSSRFTEMPVTSYKRKARKAPDVSVSTAN
nr:protein altered xyloglucan 4 [Tanacetum cinerariifolium]